MTHPIRKFFFKRSLVKILWEEAEHKIVIALYAEGAAEDFEKLAAKKQSEHDELEGELSVLERSTTREDREERKILYPKRDQLKKEVAIIKGLVAKNKTQAQELRSQAAQLHHKLAFIRKQY
ncbi:MAG: hypothetical protein AB1352_03595 [Patescibacteria group bacterium]